MSTEENKEGGTLGEGEASKNDPPKWTGPNQENVESTNSDASNASADSQTETDSFSKKHICSICGKEFVGFGNHPWPIIDTGEPCCDDCNRNVVLPARWEKHLQNSKNKKP